MTTAAKVQETNVCRKSEKEARQAVKDLIARGYEIVFPLTEFSNDGKKWKTDSFGRRIFLENTPSSCWKAKLRRVIE